MCSRACLKPSGVTAKWRTVHPILRANKCWNTAGTLCRMKHRWWESVLILGSVTAKIIDWKRSNQAAIKQVHTHNYNLSTYFQSTFCNVAPENGINLREFSFLTIRSHPRIWDTYILNASGLRCGFHIISPVTENKERIIKKDATMIVECYIGLHNNQEHQDYIDESMKMLKCFP